MSLHLHLVTALHGGAGRSLTAALLAHGLHGLGRRALLVQQSCGQLLSRLDPIASLPLPVIEVPLRPLAPDASDAVGQAFRDTIGVDTADPFLTALHKAAGDPDLIRDSYPDAAPDALHVVADLTPLAAALTVDLYRAASSLLVPVRSSPLAIEGAVRTATRLATIGVLAGAERPVLFAAIAPDEDRDPLERDLEGEIAGYDGDGELRNSGSWGHPTFVPWLSDPWLTALRDEAVWEDAALTEASAVFAAAVLTAARFASPAEGLA